MAWTVPKTDWTAPNGVAFADLNEIGNNLVYLKAHADSTGAVHGAVSAATPSRIVLRDAAGRAKVIAPSAEDDISLKSNVTTEAGARAAADAAQDVTIAALGTAKVAKAGDTMTGPLVGDFPDTDYTTAMLRNIKLMTTVPVLADLANGEIAMVYEV